MAAVQFPPGWRRTSEGDRERGRFNRAGRHNTSRTWDAAKGAYVESHSYTPSRPVAFSDALRAVQQEVQRGGGSDLRIDHAGENDRRSGEPIKGKKEPDDPGVVVCWKRGAKSYAIACDKYDDRAQNLRAIAKTIEATRGIERWGAVTGEMAFKGYEALPPASGSTDTREPHEVLGLPFDASEDDIRARFRDLAKKLHPDVGGNTEAFQGITAARDAMLLNLRREE